MGTIRGPATQFAMDTPCAHTVSRKRSGRVVDAAPFVADTSAHDVTYPQAVAVS